MGNFLSNLTRRSFTPVSGIRPRLASLFEPAGAVPPTEAALFADGEGETTAPAEEPTGLFALVMPRPNEPKPGPQIADSSSEDDLPLRNTLEAEPEPQPPAFERESAQPRLSPRPSHQTIGSVKPERSTPHVAVLKSQPTAIGSHPSESGALAPSPATVRRDGRLSIENERSAPRPPATSMVAELPARELPNLRSGQDVIPLSTNVVNRKSTAGPPLTPSVVRARKQSNRKFEDSRPEAEPVIHVTIGRVEVRAEVSGHSPSRPDRTASPVMSLDEYLRRRAKRGVE